MRALSEKLGYEFVGIPTKTAQNEFVFGVLFGQRVRSDYFDRKGEH